MVNSNNSNNNNVLSSKVIFIGRVISLAIVTFGALLLYFGSTYIIEEGIALKYVPLILSGGVGYFINRKFIVTVIAGAAAFGAYAIPPYISAPFYILPQILLFFEAAILLYSGFFLFYSILKIINSRKQISNYIVLSSCTVLIGMLCITGVLPLIANRLIGDNYIRKNYHDAKYEYCSIQCVDSRCHYYLWYRNYSGKEIQLTTNSFEVTYDSIKGTG